ncbi:MAG TPA: Do family serine endopeptidase [Terriglobales bacterium]|nr:Do family serine endopeptidase [Terriglobales bacterium]
MKEWIRKRWTAKAKRRLIAPALALALAASFVTYEFAKPVAATAAEAAPPAAPLDAGSVSALLSLDQAMETLAARVTPAVVNVAVTAKARPAAALGGQGSDDGQGPDESQIPPEFRRFFGPFFGQPFQQRPRIEHGIGTGIIISPDGYIVTNDHVVHGATDIRVTLSDRRVLPAKLVGTDPLTDLAVIKVNGTNFASIPWGDSTALRPGQTVLAFGNPLGLQFTVTRGIVSAINRANPYNDDPRKPGEFIQTDAAINPGNSGGPLVDARGQVVGINTFLISQTGGFSGMGFAIPSQIARPTTEELIRYGKVSHGYIGISINDVTPDNAKFFDLKQASGAVVSHVDSDSPGARAGLKEGDVITGVDGQTVRDAGHLQVVIGQKQPGTKVELEVLRDGKTMAVPVTLGDMSKSDNESSGSGEEHGKMRWGVGLSDLTPQVRQEIQAPADLHGAVVSQVAPGSSADNAGLQRGDVIVEVNRKPMHSADEVKEALSTVPKGQDALLLVWSNGGNTYRVMHAPEPGSGE